MKHFIFVILSCVLLGMQFGVCQSQWDGQFPNINNTYSGGGDGSSDNPYIIQSAQDLALLGVKTNADKNYTIAKHFKLVNNIDLNNLEWTPIGKGTNSPFQGVFDGGNKTISNLKITQSVSYAGLFGIIGNATIVKLDIANANLSSSSIHLGIIAGWVENATVKNCSVGGKVVSNNVSTNGWGGIVGYLASGTISNCINSANIDSWGKFVGGIAGYNREGEIIACYNVGNLTIKATGSQPCVIGGICGENHGIISASFNVGNITVKESEHRGGGIAGVNYNKISYTYSLGSLLSEASRSGFLGGLVGHNVGENALLEYSYCFGVQQNSAASLNKAALVGANANGSITRYCYNDNQLDTNNALYIWGEKLTHCASLPTREIIGTKMSDPFAVYNLGNPAQWIFEEGRYPRLAVIPVDDWVQLSVAPFILTDSDDCWSVTENFVLDTNYGVRWTSTSTDINIDSDTARINVVCDKTGNAIIQATLGRAWKAAPIYIDKASAGSIQTKGQEIVDRHTKIQTIYSKISPSGGKYTWEVSVDGGSYQLIPNATKESYTPTQSKNGTYKFRRRVAVPRCMYSELSEGIWTLVLNYSITIQQQPVADTVCFGNAATLTIGVGTTETSVLYQWQFSADSVVWRNVYEESTTANFTTSPISTPTYYRCLVSDNASKTKNFPSDVVKISVRDEFRIIVSPNIFDVCIGHDVSMDAGAEGGSEVYTYQWEGRKELEAFELIEGGNSSNFTFKPGENSHRYFRCVVTDELCVQSRTTTVGRVTVRSEQSPGEIASGKRHVCHNYEPSLIENLHLASAKEAVYQWQISIDSGSTFLDIEGATEVSYMPDVHTAVGVYIYRRMMKDNGCYPDWTSSYGADTISVRPIFTVSLGVTSNYNGVQISQKGAKDGRIEILTASSVHTPYRYSWSPLVGNTGDIITDAGEGVHTVTVTDTLGCTTTASATITYVTITPEVIIDTLRLYVTNLGQGNRTGQNWDHALPGNLLQDALNYLGEQTKGANAKLGEVWLGVGLNSLLDSTLIRLKPTRKSPFATMSSTNPRDLSFVIPSGVSLFGSFQGNEKRKIDRTSRLDAQICTLLTGELSSGEKVYNVLIFGDGSTPLAKTSIVDGILVLSGNANSTGTSSGQKRGAGVMMVENSIFRSGGISNCSASENGGGVYMLPGSWLVGNLIEKCSAKNGGGVYTARTATSLADEKQRVNIIENTIVNNKALSAGAGCYINNYIFMYGNVVWNNTINSISRNNNVKLANDDGNRPDYGYDVALHNIRTLYANDDFVSSYGVLPFVLSDVNRDEKGPHFLDPFNDNGILNPIPRGAFQLDVESPLIQATPDYIQSEADLSRFKLDILDANGNKRFVTAMDIGAFENQRLPVMKPTNNRLYVSDRRRGEVDGSSWDNATNSLQRALNYFEGKTPNPGERFEIWVSEGIYYPSSLSEFGNVDRNRSYSLKEDVDIYGGFTGESGTEGFMNEATRPRVDLDGNGLIEAWEFKHATILSGEIAVAGGSATNAYHVITYRDATSNSLASNLILDGLFITKGNANGEGADSKGSGLYAQSPLIIQNCAFMGNFGSSKTQGVAIYASEGLDIRNSCIMQNYQSNVNDTTAAIYFEDEANITQCLIASNDMIGVYSATGTLDLNQSTLVKNKLAVRANKERLSNSVIWGNTENQEIGNSPTDVNNSAVQGLLFPGEGNINLDASNTHPLGPQFRSIKSPFAYYPDCTSPLLDKGVATVGLDKDITMSPRIHQGFVDIGAYESQVDSIITGSIANTGNEICYNTISTVEIGSIKQASGGTLPITYQWTANGEFLADSDKASFTPPKALKENTVFKRFVSDAKCNSQKMSEGEWLVSVHKELKAKQAGKDTVVCFNASVPLYVNVSGGSETHTFQWQISTDNKTFTNFETADAHEVSMLAPAQNKIYYVRCQIEDSKCGSVYSDTLKIQNYAEFKTGSIDSRGQTVCQGQANIRISELEASLGGVPPYTYSWHVSNQEIVSDTAKAKEYTPLLTSVGLHTYKRYVSDSICQTTPLASEGEWQLNILKRPSVTIWGDTTIAYGQEAKIHLEFKGTPDFSYRLAHETANRTSSTNSSEIIVAPLKTQDYSVTALSDGSMCSAKEQDLLGNARVNVYYSLITFVNPLNTATVEAYRKSDGISITPQTQLDRMDTVIVKIKPHSAYYLKNNSGLLHNGKDSTRAVFANYTEGNLLYTFSVTESVKLNFDFIATSPWDGSSQEPFKSINGDSLLIYHSAELAYLSSSKNNSESFQGKAIKLMNDFDLGGSDNTNFNPIGHSDKPFQGFFDGNAKTISNLRIYYPSGRSNVGLFGNIGANGHVTNFKLLSGSILSNLDHVGAIAGRSSGTINHVYNHIPIIGGKSYVGGLVGLLSSSGKIFNSYNAASIRVPLNGSYVGGLVGQSAGSIAYSFNLGSVVGMAKVGGLIGETLPGAAMEYCYNAGEISGNIDVNGFIGFNSSDNISNSYTVGGYRAIRTTTDNRKPLQASCFTDILMTSTPYEELMSTPRKTSEMTGTALQSSLGNADRWEFTSNMYPRLKAMKDLDASIVSVLPIFLADPERKDSIKSNFTYTEYNGVTWTSSVSDQDPITIASGNASVTRKCGLNQIDTLTITKGDAVRILTAKVLGYPNFNSGKIAETGENICFGQTPTQIGEAIAPIGSEANIYTYSWYKDDVEITSPDAQNATYTPTESSAGSYVYTRKVAQADCNPSGTFSQGQWMLTIKPDLSLIKYTENQNICYETNIDLSFIVEGGDGIYTYTWEQSHDGNTWTNALNSTNSSQYSTPNLTQKTYFRCAVESCGIEDTVKGTINVYEQFNSGAITAANLNLCHAVSAGQITELSSVSGGVPPYTYRWIRKAGGVSTILNQNVSEYMPATMSPISKDTTLIYIREVKDNKCNTNFTSSIGEVSLTTFPKFEASIALTSNYFGMPLSAIGASDASVKVTPVGGSKNYTYTWQKNGVDMGLPTAEIKNLSAATYKATIHSVVNGINLSCPLTEEITISDVSLIPAIVNTDTLRIYATYQGAGELNGNSWNNAIPNTLLQSAIDHLDSIQGKNSSQSFEIWLGVGRDLEVGRTGTAYFYPSKRSPYVSDDTDPRAKSFVLPSGINIFGAFYGIETSKNERTDRSTIRTILSGYFSEKDRLDLNSDRRVYNVLVFGDGKNPLAKPTVIDGISLMHGNANSTDNAKPKFQQGGGTTLVSNAIMRNGYAGRNYAKRGGGVYMKAGSWLTGSIFVRDTAEIGAAIYVETAQDGDITDINKRANIVANTVSQCEAIDNTTNTNSGSAGLFLGDYVFMANTVIWDNRYNGISSNNNVKLQTPYDPSKHLFQYVAYNDSSKGEDIKREILLTNSNKSDLPHAQSPMFLDPYNPSATTIKGFSIGDIASSLKLIEGGITTQTELAEYRLDELDYTGNPRLVGQTMDIGAYEMQDILNLEAFEGRRLYVSRYPRGKRDGSSWSNATNSIQYALDYFETKDLPQGLDFFEVWVSEGDYTPSRGHAGGSLPIHYSFVLNNKTNLYGGFEGTEKSIDDRVREDRTPNGTVEKWEFSGYTTLSGEILVGAIGKQYVRHVIYRPASTQAKNIIVDGFVIQKSLAVDEDATETMHPGGGGIWAEDSIQMQNCLFFAHKGSDNASGVAVRAKNATIKDCFFSANENEIPVNKKNTNASLLNLENSKLQSSVIAANYMIAVELEGNGNMLLNNTILLNNGGVKMSENSTNVLTNNVIWKNYSLDESGDTTYNEFIGSSSMLNNNAIQGMNLGNNGINLSKNQVSAEGPRFTFLDEEPDRIVFNNLIPDCFSPLLNSGTEVELDTTDMACAPRKFGSAIDLGAFESQVELLNPGTIDSIGEVICYGTIPSIEIQSLEEKSGGKNTSGYIWYANGEVIEDANAATYCPESPLVETTVFSRWAIDDCYQAEDLAIQAKGTYTITVHPELELPTPLAQKICYNNSALIIIEPRGGDEVYTYQWYIKDEADENYTILEGQTGKSLQTPNLSRTTGYQCKVSSCGQIKQSSSIVITVNPELKVQTQPSSSTICHNAKATLSMRAQGGGTSYNYLWQKRANPSAEWENISNSNVANYTSEFLSENTYFRCRINSCGNDSVYTHAVLISVFPEMEFVNQSEDEAVCYNSNTELKVEVSGGGGSYLYQWQKASIDGDDWQNAPGISTNAKYITEASIHPYQYRCIVTDGCDNTTTIQSETIKLINSPMLSIVSQPKATDTICYNTNAQPLKIEVSGGDGKYEYEWMKRFEDEKGKEIWEVLLRSENPNYTPDGTQTQTQRYKCAVSSCGNMQISQEAEIAVRGKLKAGIISDTTIAICFGEEVPLIENIESPSGGSGRYKIVWVDGDVEEYVGIHTLDFKPNVSDSGTYFFERIVQDTVCSSSAWAGSFKLIINQEPELESVNDQILCVDENSAPVIFRSPNTQARLSYTWINNKMGYGLPLQGDGDIPSYKALNPGYASDSLTINVTPILTHTNKSCSGKSISFKYIINPSPQVNTMSNRILCAATSQNIEFKSGNTGGESTFNWSSSLGDNSMSYIGLPSPIGSGNINFISANNQNTPQTSTLTIVPSFTANGKTCTAALSDQKTMNITVNPIPKLISADTIAAICSGSAVNYTLKTNMDKAMATWKRPAIANINNGVEKTGTDNILEDILINNTTDQIQEVQYEYTITANACGNATPYPVRVKVYPPFLKGSIGSSTQTLCNNTQTLTQPIVIQATGGNGIIFYEWREQKDTAAAKVVATTVNYSIPAKKEPGTYIYTLWVRNEACNPTWTQSIGQHTITVLSSLQSTIAVTSNFNGLHIEEPEANNGRAKIVVSGGLKPYTYLWSSSETIDSIRDKAPGKYTVSVRDANACVVDTNVTIKPIAFTPKSIADTSRFYVSYLGNGLRNGSSWENALPRQVLQYALDTAGKIAQAPRKYAEVWVGIGLNYNSESNGAAVFTPNSSRKHSPFVSNFDDPRAKSFVIPSGVGLYGTFIGHETNKERSNRTSTFTVLSGDLNLTPDIMDDDAYNVVVFGNGIDDLEKPAYLNGFVIRLGNANHLTIESMQRGGGVVSVSNAAVQNVIMTDNNAIYGGAVYMQGKSYLNSSLLYENKAQQGGAVYAKPANAIASGPRLAYNTIVNNEATIDGAGVYLGENLTFMGNVVWNNTIGGISKNNNIKVSSLNPLKYMSGHIFANDSMVPFFGANSVFLSNINNDTLNHGPMFNDPLSEIKHTSPFQAKTFTLSSLSPMRNRVELIQPEYLPATLRLDPYDIYGQPRKIGDAIDFNAAEYERAVYPKPTNNRLYVSNQRRGTLDGSSWGNSMTNLSLAIGYFAERTPAPGERFEIWISEGTFFPQANIAGTNDIRHHSFTLNENIDIYGGFRGLPGDEDVISTRTRPRIDLDADEYTDAWEYKNMTTLSGNIEPSISGFHSYHVVYRTQGNSNSTIDGLRIMSGNANGSTLQDRLGGGLYTEKPMTVRNCVFVSNKASKSGHGSAIYAVNSLIDASYIASNGVDGEAQDTNLSTGAVAMLGGNIRNSIIATNSTSGLITLGELPPHILNTTIANNTVGIVDFADANTSVINTVIWNNKRILNNETSYSSILHLNGSLSISYSAMEDIGLNKFEVGNNLHLDRENEALYGPHFMRVNAPNGVNTYRLNCLSPLINMGDSAKWTEADVDFAGNPRIVEHVDIGAYETQSLSLQGGEIESRGEAICHNTIPTQTIGNITQAQGGVGKIQYSWFYNDTLIEGATETSYLPTQRLMKSAIYTRHLRNECGQEMISKGSWQVRVRTIPSATLSGSAHLNKGDSTNLQIVFTGRAPFTFRLNTDSEDRVHTSSTPFLLKVSPRDTTLYKIISFADANDCGVPADSIKGEAHILVSEYVNVQFTTSFGGEIILSKVGKILKGTSISVHITPNANFYLQRLSAKAKNNTVYLDSIPVYVDLAQENLIAEFIATQDTNIIGVFAPLTPWKMKIESARFTKDGNTAYIYTAGELAYIAKQMDEFGKTYENVQFKLMRNLDMGGVQENTGIWNEKTSSIWLPLGGNGNTAFRGKFDGNNKQITKLYVNKNSENVGLFGHLGAGAEVKNLAITSGFVKGVSHVGSIAGILDSNASISQVFSMANVQAEQSHAGGLVGINKGTIENAYNVGHVEALNYAGGIAALNIGSINHTYNIGQIKGGIQSFGISLNEGKVSQSYFDGQMIGLDYKKTTPLQAGLYTHDFDTVFANNPLWRQNSQHYPSLLAFDTTQASALSILSIQLQTKENVHKLRSDIFICQDHNIRAEVLNDDMKVASVKTYGLAIKRSVQADGNFILKVSNAAHSRYLNLSVDAIKTSNVELFDSICSGTSYTFGNRELSESGTYYDSLLNRYEDDSLVSLHLIVIGEEKIEIDTVISICSTNEEDVYFNFNILSGYPTTYNLLFDTLSKSVSFEDVVSEPLVNNQIKVHIPQKKLPPNEYTSLLEFKNHANCPASKVTIKIKQNFDAKQIIQQKDNFMLYLKNKDYNGGYTFKSYQWLFDDQDLNKETKSYYYSSSNLRTDADYSVRLQLESGVILDVCPFKADISAQEIKVYPSNIKRGQDYVVSLLNFGDVPENTYVELFDMQGKLLETKLLTSNETVFSSPRYTGVYMLKVAVPNRTVQTFKIIVN